MIVRILLIEDEPSKRKSISSSIVRSFPDVEIDTAGDVIEGKRKLQSKRYDLLLLDINLPRRVEKDPDAQGGLEVLRWLKGRGVAHRPGYIVGITAHEESFNLANLEFDNLIWSIIYYSQSSNEWHSRLVASIEEIRKEITPPFKRDGATHHIDVLVVTALQLELDAILKLKAGWTDLEVAHDASRYHLGKLVRGRKSVSVVAVSASDKGLSGAAIAATKGIGAFSPRYVYMPGITAGVKKRTNIGDVIFADPTWDWGSGKLKVENEIEVFHPAQYQWRLDESIRQAALALSSKNILEPAWMAIRDKRPPFCPVIRVGAMASGGSVLQSSVAVDRVVENHKDLLAIEMEAFSIMFACQASPTPRPKGIVAKGVSDAGDEDKEDFHQVYAADMSALVFQEFAFGGLIGSDNDNS